MRKSRKKNFKNLKLDMTMCKNNLRTDDDNLRCDVPDERPTPVAATPDSLTPLTPFSERDFSSLSPIYEDYENIPRNGTDPIPHTECSSPEILNPQSKVTSFQDVVAEAIKKSNIEGNEAVMESKDIESDPEDNSLNLPTLAENSPNLTIRNTDNKKSPNLSLVSLPASQDISLSDGEEIFADLSNEICDDLSDDEEMFERLSMQIDLDDVEEKFDLTLNESSHDIVDRSSEEQQVVTTQASKPESGEILTGQEGGLVSRKTSLKKDIAYWEKRSSWSPESRVLGRQGSNQFQRGTLQRSTVKKKKMIKIETSSTDCHLGSHRFVEESVAAKMVSGESDLVETTPSEKSVNSGPYFDEGKNLRCTEQLSIIPKPAPRKSLLGGRTKVLDRNNPEDKCSHLPKLEGGSKVLATSFTFSIMTWEERKAEKDRILPTKRLLEWF